MPLGISTISLLMSNDHPKKYCNDSIAIEIKFDDVSRAMKARKNAKGCCSFRASVFSVLLFKAIVCMSWLTDIGGSTRKQFGFLTKSLQCDD